MAKIPAETNNQIKKQEIMKGKELKILFLLDQKLKQIPGSKIVDERITHISNIIMDCVDRCAPEKQVAAFKTPGDWINNLTKNAMVRRLELFQSWISQPTEKNKNCYRRF